MGSATVELALLLPAYALVILSSLYFGYGWLTQQEGFEASHYASHSPGDQSGDLGDHFFRAYDGSPDLREYDWGSEPPWFEQEPWADLHTWGGDIFKAEDPYSGNDWFDFHDILQELSYTFWGGFVMEGGDLVWKNEGGLNRTGKYIQDHDIQGEEQRNSMAWVMNEWVVRASIGTKMSYGSDPLYVRGMNTSPGPAGGEATPFRPPGENEDGEAVTSVTDAMLRGERQRPLVDPQKGVHSHIFDLIRDNFSDFEDMRDPEEYDTKEWWNQDRRPDLDEE
jgi:hypothetical protein